MIDARRHDAATAADAMLQRAIRYDAITLLIR